MTADPIKEYENLFQFLSEYGVVAVTDNAFPSVTGFVVGQPVKGSWWSHPLAHAIFAVNEMLEEHRDVLTMKLISRKVTFVHRSIWNHVYSIVTAGDAWQMAGLSTTAQRLLKTIEKRGIIDTNRLESVVGVKPGDVARELELRLLIHARQVHTESGSHAKILEAWDSWANRVGLKDREIDLQTAKEFLEQRVKELNDKFDARAKLPWQ